MAKNNNGGVDAGVRKAKPKSAAQKAKAARNVEEAQKRLERLQREQRAVQALRKEGAIGDDQTLLRMHYDRMAKVEREKEEQNARMFVDRALNGPHRDSILAFLRDRPGTPLQIARVIRNFCHVKGLKVA